MYKKNYIHLLNDSEPSGVTNKQKKFLDVGFNLSNPKEKNNWKCNNTGKIEDINGSGKGEFFIDNSTNPNLSDNLYGLKFANLEQFSYNGPNLMSLVGCPEKVNRFSITHTQIKDLLGGPIEITSNCKIGHNQELVSLNGAPKKIWGIFKCNDNPKLRTLKEFPLDVKGQIVLDKLNLDNSLDGISKKLDVTIFTASECNIRSLLNAPKLPNCKELSIKNNNLITLMGIEYMLDSVRLSDFKSDFAGNPIHESILISGLKRYINEKSWCTYHRFLLRKFKEEVLKWISLITNDVKKEFLLSLELTIEDANEIQTLLSPIYHDSFVRNFILDLNILDSNISEIINIDGGLKEIGF